MAGKRILMTNTVYTRLVRALRNAADTVCPETCAVCGTELIEGEHILCLNCLCDLPQTYTWKAEENTAEERIRGRIPCESVTSLFFFRDKSPFNRLVYKLKYSHRYDIGIYLGKLLGRRIAAREEHPANRAECIIPVPVHPLRKYGRGYNQAEIIAEGISSVTGIPVNRKTLKRASYRKSQTATAMEDKWKNVSGSFRTSGGCRCHEIILADDVLTSGSTLESCCMSLKKTYPDMKINIVTIAFVE